MKTIIHIGQHKTGTTSIQNYLKSNRDNLIAEGLYVPVGLAGFEHPSHFILNVYALAQNRMSPMKERFVDKSGDFLDKLFTQLRKDICAHYESAQKEGCDTVIWTNEGLYLLNSIDEYKKLYGLFGEYSSSIQCVCCFREIESFRASYIKQLKKQGIELGSEPDSYRYLKPDSWLFDYEKKKKLLKKVFEDVVSFDYDRSDNVRNFLKVLGYSIDYVHTQERLNVTRI